MVIHFACQKLDTKALPKLTRKCIFVRELKFYKKELLEEGMLAETKNFDQRESFFFFKIRIATVFFSHLRIFEPFCGHKTKIFIDLFRIQTA